MKKFNDKSVQNKLIVCNWKTLVTTIKDAKKILTSYQKFDSKTKKKLVVCPSTALLFLVKEAKLTSGCQSISPELSGATTGLVSNEIMKELKVSYALLGHSEERARGLVPATLQLQISRSLEAGIIPIVCIGEKTRDQEGDYFIEFKKQLDEVYNGLSKNQAEKIILAYEPIWAIGAKATRPATIEEAEEMALYAKRYIKTELYPTSIAIPKVIYGGSVDEKNSESFLNSYHLDGLLIGRASTQISVFKTIISSINKK